MTAPMATDPTLEAILAERWHMASTEVRNFANESVPSEVNSEAMTEMVDSFRAIATRMVHEIRGGQEEAWLDDLEFTLLGAVEKEILHFARQIETLRAARKEAAA